MGNHFEVESLTNNGMPIAYGTSTMIGRVSKYLFEEAKAERFNATTVNCQGRFFS